MAVISVIPQLSFTHVKANYFELVNTIIPGPQSLSYFLPHILLPISLLIPPEILSHNALASISMPIILASTIHAWVAMRGIDVISTDTLWWCFFYLVFRDPRRAFQRLVQEQTNGSEGSSDIIELGYPKRFWPRVQWVLLLLSERPLTSWKTGVRSHDATVLAPHVGRSRITFIKSVLAVLLPALFIIMPLSLQLKSHDPFFSGAGQSLLSPLPSGKFPSLICLIYTTIPRILLRPITLGMYIYSLLTLLFLPPHLLPVLFTYIINSPFAPWSPHTWPRPHFGPFSAVLDSGLRGLWGKWWHQQMRHAVSEPGRWIAEKMGLRKGRLVRYAILCGSAFLLSGTTHAGLVVSESRWARIRSVGELRLGVAGFFWVQPVGILAELVVVERVLEGIGKLMSKAVGAGLVVMVQRSLRLAWVLLFLSFALTFLLDPFIELGFWGVWPPAFFPDEVNSVLRGNRMP